MKTRITSGFWADRKELNKNVTIQSIYDRFAETGRFSALKCGRKPGMENKPHIFFDSDTAKWIEAASYIIGAAAPYTLNTHGALPEETGTLSVKVDEMVADIIRNQREDLRWEMTADASQSCAGLSFTAWKPLITGRTFATLKSQMLKTTKWFMTRS